MPLLSHHHHYYHRNPATTAMSCLAELEKALNEEKARLLRQEAEEAERERTRQAEEAERARQAPEPSGSGKGVKRKAPDEGEEAKKLVAPT